MIRLNGLFRQVEHFMLIVVMVVFYLGLAFPATQLYVQIQQWHNIHVHTQPPAHIQYVLVAPQRDTARTVRQSPLPVLMRQLDFRGAIIHITHRPRLRVFPVHWVRYLEQLVMATHWQNNHGLCLHSLTAAD